MVKDDFDFEKQAKVKIITTVCCLPGISPHKTWMCKIGLISPNIASIKKDLHDQIKIQYSFNLATNYQLKH